MSNITFKTFTTQAQLEKAVTNQAVSIVGHSMKKAVSQFQQGVNITAHREFFETATESITRIEETTGYKKGAQNRYIQLATLVVKFDKYMEMSCVKLLTTKKLENADYVKAIDDNECDLITCAFLNDTWDKLTAKPVEEKSPEVATETATPADVEPSENEADMTNMQKAESFMGQIELLLTPDEFRMLLTDKLAK